MIGAALVACGADIAKPDPPLQVVAEFPQQLVTGVAVSSGGRIFVNFPYWSDPHLLSVAELVDGRLEPYPNRDWNRKTGAPAERFVCVQSVYVDDRNRLWILDPASPKMEGVVSGGAKLLQVDLAANRVVRTYSFDRDVAPSDSYLNDVRVDPASGQAYLTDSGAGAIVVVDLESGEARRLLEEHPSVVPEKNVRLVIEGRPLSDANQEGEPAAIAADSIALDAAGGYLYYKPLTGYTLYRIKLEDLRNERLTAEELGDRVETVADAPASDGLGFRDGRVFFTAIEDNAIIAYDLEAREAQTVVADPTLKWPDSLAFGPDGALYVTTSQIHLTPRFNGGESRRREPFRVLKLPRAMEVTARRTAE